MEAIILIAKKNKSGKYKIDLPINNDGAKIEVLVIVEEKKSKKTLTDFAGKLEWKGDWVAYQKKGMSGSKFIFNTNILQMMFSQKFITLKFKLIKA